MLDPAMLGSAFKKNWRRRFRIRANKNQTESIVRLKESLVGRDDE